MGVRLTRLSLCGFKSFADPVELVVDPGITAIVGPNGSGKSNLAEAIAWVLGEQAGAAVRSRRAEDVIFAGGPGRPSVGMAEVTLVLEQDGDELGLPFREVSLTRRVFRDGEGQYLINGARARLRDVLQIASALRAEWVIVRQGAVDAILDQRPSERRDFLEHAAGLSGLRLRQAETRQQLADAEAHADRLEDLLRELEPHLRTLADAAERAREALATRGALRNAMLQLLAARWRRAHDALEQSRTRAAQLRTEREELLAARERLARELAALEAELQLLETRTNEMSRQRYQHERALVAAQHRAQLARTRTETVLARSATLARAREQLEREYEELDRERGRVSAAEAAVAEELTVLSQQLRDLEQAASERAQQRAALRRSLSELEQQRRTSATQLERLARDRAALLASGEARRADLARLRNEHAARQAEQLLVERERAELEERWVAHSAALEQAERETDRLRVECDRVEAEVARRERVVRELEREYAAVRTRLELLSQALEGELVTSATRAVLAAAKRGQLTGIVGPLGALIEVPAELEAAIEAALGGHAYDVVVERWSDAEAAIEFLKRTRAGRATFHPLDSVRAIHSNQLPAIVREAGVLGIAADLVRVSSAVQPVVRSLLGRVIVVSDLATARRLLPLLPPSWVMVTRDGEITRPTGSVTGGSPRSRERGLLAHARERRDLAARLERLETMLARARQELAVATEESRRLRAAYDASLRNLQHLRDEEAALTRERERLERTRAGLVEKLAEVTAELARLEATLERDQARLAELAEAEQALQARVALLQDEERALANRLAELERPDPERERLAKQVAVLEERCRALEHERFRLDQQLARLAGRRTELERERVELERTHSALLGELEEAEQEAGRFRDLLERLASEEQRLRELLERQAQQVAAYRGERAALEERLQALERDLAAAEAAVERAEQASQNVLESAAWELGASFPPEQLIALLREQERENQAIEALERRVALLRRRWQELSRFGEAAIAQYESERERYETLRAQLADVRANIQLLRELLTELDRQIERGFARSLRALDRAFATTFIELFGGGRARLVARDGTGAIDGVELVVQPAGKRVRTIQQLSGGERALTALALRLALLEVSPVPFLVLDEVDAALDEANVLRFRALLERFTARTQFLVITHNRATIEAAGTLYGVTMGDDGASRLVSLRLSDYAST